MSRSKDLESKAHTGHAFLLCLPQVNELKTSGGVWTALPVWFLVRDGMLGAIREYVRLCGVEAVTACSLGQGGRSG